MAQLKSTNVLGNLAISGNTLSSKFIKLGGTDTQALLANGETKEISGTWPISVSGNAGTATKLAAAKTISLTGDVTGSASFDGSGSVSITATVADSSHNHNASNITAGSLSSDRLPTVPISKGGTGATSAAAALTNLGLTATAAELNKMDGVTATTAELNYVDGVTSNIQTQLNGKAPSSHTHSADNITQGYLNIHPENSGAIIPFINNDLGFLTKRGGSCSIYSTTSTDYTVATLTSGTLSVSGMESLFDGSPSYCTISTTGSFVAVIDLTLHKTFTYSNQFYIDFGANGWRAKGIAVYVMNKDTETKYTLKGSTTTNGKGNWYCDVSHNSKNSSGTRVEGFNKMRIVLSSFNNTSSSSGKRIAQVGLLNYGSAGATETFISRGGCSGIYGSLIPHTNNGVNLGSSDKKWNTVYASTFNGNATSATAASTLSVTDTTPTSATSYYLWYSTGRSGAQTARANADLYVYDTGTSSYLNIGSSNHSGMITLHHSKGGYVNIQTAEIPSGTTRTLTIPNANGTISLEGHTHSYLPLAGGRLTGLITSSYSSSTWLNSVNGKSAFNLSGTGYVGWIGGPCKDGRLVISSYPGNNNRLYFGYMSKTKIDAGSTSLDYRMSWEGSSGTLFANKFAMSSGDTGKAAWQYNSTMDCIELAWY